MITKHISLMLIAFSLLSTNIINVSGSTKNVDETMDDPAEVNLLITDKAIQSINIGNWTPIHMTLQDLVGIDFSKLRQLKFFGIPLTDIWQLTHSDWRPLLGYTSLRLNFTVISGNPKGWHFKVDPTNSFPHTEKNMKYPLTLYAKIDDSAVDYNIVLGIECIRYDLFNDICGYSLLKLPLKAQPSMFLKMYPNNFTKIAQPKSIVEINYTISNQGYYKEIFSFEVNISDNLTTHFNTPVAVLNPGEPVNITLSVLIPETFFDIGTPYNITTYAIRQKDGTKFNVGTYTIIRKGLYLSPLTAIQMLLGSIVLTIGFIFISIIRDTFEQKHFGKPNKPWKIPIEERMLLNLKRKDSEQYKKTYMMMKDEYQSAILWYKDLRKHNKNQR